MIRLVLFCFVTAFTAVTVVIYLLLTRPLWCLLALPEQVLALADSCPRVRWNEGLRGCYGITSARVRTLVLFKE